MLPPPVEVLVAGPARPPAPASWFDGIVRPLATQEFLDTRYRTSIRSCSGRRGRASPRCAPGTRFNGLLSSTAWQGRMHLVRDGKPIPEHYYTAPYFGHGWRARRGGSNERQIDDGRLAAFLRKGATVVMPGLQEIHPPSALWPTHSMRPWAATPGSISTPPGRRPAALQRTGDDHDVFVLQVAGTKRWHLYGETRRFPAPPRCGAEREAAPGDGVERGDKGGATSSTYRGGGGTTPAPSPATVRTTPAACTLAAASSRPPGSTSWSGSPEGSPATRRSAATFPTPRTGSATPTTRPSGSSSSKSCEGTSDRGSATTCDPLGPSARGRASARPSSPGSLPTGERYGIRLRGASHATTERSSDGDLVLEANGYRWTFDGRCMALMAPLLRGETVRVGAFREAAAEGAVAEGAAPEGVSASFADEVARVLVMRGIAQAVPPAAASGPEG